MKEKILIFGLLIFLVFGIVYIRAETLAEVDYKNNLQTYASATETLDSGFVSWALVQQNTNYMWETLVDVPDYKKNVINKLSPEQQLTLFNNLNEKDKVKQKDFILQLNPEKRNPFFTKLTEKTFQGLEKLDFKGKTLILEDNLLSIKDPMNNVIQIPLKNIPKNIDLISFLTEKGMQYENSKNSNVFLISKGYIKETNDEKMEIIGSYSGDEKRENPIIDLNQGKNQAIMISDNGQIAMWGDKIIVDIGDNTFKPNSEGPKDEYGRPYGFVNEIHKGVFNLKGDVSAPGVGLVIYDTEKGIFDSTGNFNLDKSYYDVIFRYKLGKTVSENILSISGDIEGYASFRTFDNFKFEYRDINGKTSVAALIPHVDNLGANFKTFYELVKPIGTTVGETSTETLSQTPSQTRVRESPAAEVYVPRTDDTSVNDNNDYALWMEYLADIESGNKETVVTDTSDSSKVGDKTPISDGVKDAVVSLPDKIPLDDSAITSKPAPAATIPEEITNEDIKVWETLFSEYDVDGDGELEVIAETKKVELSIPSFEPPVPETKKTEVTWKDWEGEEKTFTKQYIDSLNLPSYTPNQALKPTDTAVLFFTDKGGSCEYCNQMEEEKVMNTFSKDVGNKIYEIDTSTTNGLNLYHQFKDTWSSGNPAILFVRNGNIVGQIKGYNNVNGIKDYLNAIPK